MAGDRRSATAERPNSAAKARNLAGRGVGDLYARMGARVSRVRVGHRQPVDADAHHSRGVGRPGLGVDDEHRAVQGVDQVQALNTGHNPLPLGPGLRVEPLRHPARPARGPPWPDRAVQQRGVAGLDGRRAPAGCARPAEQGSSARVTGCMKAAHAAARRSCRPAGPQSPVRFLVWYGAKKNRAAGPAGRCRR